MTLEDHIIMLRVRTCESLLVPIVSHHTNKPKAAQLAIMERVSTEISRMVARVADDVIVREYSVAYHRMDMGEILALSDLPFCMPIIRRLCDEFVP